jgi:hypothetical protein
MAYEQNHLDTVQWLLAAGADPNQTDSVQFLELLNFFLILQTFFD